MPPLLHSDATTRFYPAFTKGNLTPIQERRIGLSYVRMLLWEMVRFRVLALRTQGYFRPSSSSTVLILVDSLRMMLDDELVI